ncbi:MAG: phosphoribosylanthranilate isomerase [Henriciella sp.]|jgi:phosphoribosylanthranilate isomerase|nr:phosphoribosylanthranilate isomerase [Henriciella sp.]MBO6693853.1 phosphoribosylanthranilate isomerase [Henriciella sp.]
MAQVKICGLTDTAHIRAAAEAGADWVGFVLYPKSPRNILGEGEDALDEVCALNDFAQDLGLLSVILLVDPGEDLFDDVLHEVEPDAIQLHGKESPDQVLRWWRDCSGICELWRAVGVSTEDDLEALDQWRVDRFLIDAKPPEDADRPGGNGETMDWSLLDGFQPDVPWILAGGLTSENVETAIAATGATAVDVSSGVESAPGLKDEDLIRAFIDAAKSA